MSGSAPLSYMAGGGSRSAQTLQTLAWGFSAICTAVVVIVAVLILISIRRSRRAAIVGPDGIAGEGDGLMLIWWGLGLSFPVLAAMAVWNFLVTRQLAEPPSKPGVTIEVTAHQWWWSVRYLAGGANISAANEVVIPTGVPVRLQLASNDVIHDFWVPKLGPKMDMIPGQTNQTWLEADRPGVYRGQCAEYCGLEHARMAFTVRAVTPALFRQWLAHEAQPAYGTNAAFDNAAHSPPSGMSPSGVPSEGPGAMLPEQTIQATFESRCGACHAVRGTSAGGIAGPDLTHFGSRGTIAAGWMANTLANLDRWLQDPQAVKPGVKMPRVQLTPNERGRMAAWLERLS
ncbi:cytochrome c oxidase subunit II [Novosphingobium sp. Gsoil 351]|uniref:cytochrome c oxidase subunit II n=1 Tax=Novosphingobium sp. Gsoil 351 TaxID=2675225 RepID=UPI0012B48F46|nr:cytochrome c oxidase subunit II [Novosphingobium sp. Gsoil 351]QGN54127.1 cytochrome c oxidase subunit II [Novosphingobium sp. Gsoil 351]